MNTEFTGILLTFTNFSLEKSVHHDRLFFPVKCVVFYEVHFPPERNQGRKI